MAGKFHYRLQKVLTMREKREDELKLELSAGERERNRERDLLDELRNRQNSAQKQMGQQLQAGLAGGVQMSNDYLASLDGKIKAQEKKLKLAEAAVEELQKKVKQAGKDRFILEKHREKSKARWQAEAKRLEDLKMEEMVGNMTAAKKRKADEDKAFEDDEAERLALTDAERALLDLDLALDPAAPPVPDDGLAAGFGGGPSLGAWIDGLTAEAQHHVAPRRVGT